MTRRITELENVVLDAVALRLTGTPVTDVEVWPDEDDPERLTVMVHVAKSKTRLPGDTLLQIVNAASDAIAAAGEDRFPIVFGRFAATQEFVAA